MATLAAPSPKAKPFSYSPHNGSVHKPAQTFFIKSTPNYHDSAKNVLQSSNLNVLKANGKRVITPVMSSALTQVPESGDNSRIGRIFLSDVVVKRRRDVFWGRKWNSMDIGTAGVLVAMNDTAGMPFGLLLHCILFGLLSITFLFIETFPTGVPSCPGRDFTHKQSFDFKL